MAIFGWGKETDTSELQEQLREKQDELMKQLENLDLGNEKSGGRFWLGLLFGGALGAGVLYFLDAEKGEERRQSLLQAASSMTGGGMDDTAERDQQLTGKVEADLFRDASIPKGQINVNTVDGVVYLRGTASNQQQISTIEQRIKQIEGVEAVINLLRLPSTAATAAGAAGASATSGGMGGTGGVSAGGGAGSASATSGLGSSGATGSSSNRGTSGTGGSGTGSTSRS